MEMPFDWELLERPFEVRERENEKMKIRGRAASRPPDLRTRQQSWHRPPLPSWMSGHGSEWFDRASLKQPCPYPLTPDPRSFRELEAVSEARTGLLTRDQVAFYRPALIALSAHRRDWLRSPDSWPPPEGDTREQFSSLVRHLFTRYDLPRFLDNAWTEGLTPDGVRHQGWFKHVASGRNLRSARHLPLSMTSRMAHYFLRAPDDFSIPAAIRYGHVISLGGDESLVRSLLATRIGIDFREHEFWSSVIRWFIANPEVSTVDHGPIVDFLHGQKFVPSVPNPSTRLRGRPRQPLVVVPQPHLSMKGRTPDAMLRSVEQWHRRLASERMTYREWKPSGIIPLVVGEGLGPDRKIYETTELICTEELREEGRAMRHCIASYWNICAKGQSSVWSLTVENASGHVERLLTLLVRNGPRELAQARGASNRMPTAPEWSLLRRWTELSGFSGACPSTIAGVTV